MNNIHLWRWACTAYIAYFTQTAQTVKGAWESCSLKYGCMRNALFELQLHKKCAVWSTTTWDNGNELTGMRHKDALASNKYYYWQKKTIPDNNKKLLLTKKSTIVCWFSLRSLLYHSTTGENALFQDSSARSFGDFFPKHFYVFK